MTRILVIESENKARHTMRNILEGAGYEVELAEDGALGARLHSSHPADLVIADTDDVEPAVQAFVGTRMLALPNGLGIPYHVRALNTLPKPFRRDDLLSAVRTTLEMTPPPSVSRM
ncbi:MAG: hypothetical protein ACM33T_14210 [Solirubrobacterales bacterium]